MHDRVSAVPGRHERVGRRFAYKTVTIQAQILSLLRDLKDRLGMAMLLITHDMGVIAGHADRVNVMYAGRVVETAEAGQLFSEMHHPYTQALLASIPQLK